MPKGNIGNNNRYYLVVSEWLYPTESGESVFPYTFDTRKEALEFSKKECEKERQNFETVCGDSVSTTACGNHKTVKGHILTVKNGLDEWWFYSKVICVKYGA